VAETVYILLGSNIGDREKNLGRAIASIETIPGVELVATSAIYLSDAEDMAEDSPSFLNQVAMADYEYRPQELLVALEAIETKMGRIDKGNHLPRVIDLDILLFGDQIIETEELSIPHRQLLNRSFAMLPLLQITPEIIHPVTGKPVSSFLSPDDTESVMLYKDHVARNI